MNFILADSAVFWIITSIIFAIIELFIFSNVGFLYAAISSIITAFAIYAGYVSPEALLAQFSLVAVLSVSIFTFTNLVIRRVIANKGSVENVSNVVGKQAIVVNDGITKGAFGCIRFAGQVMTAKLAKEVTENYIPEGTFVEVLSVNGTIATVKPVYNVSNNKADDNTISQDHIEDSENIESGSVSEKKNLEDTKEKEFEVA